MTAVLLREVFGKNTGAEAAQALRTSEGAVKAALHRARTAIRPLKERLSSIKDEDRLHEDEIDDGEKDLAIA